MPFLTTATSPLVASGAAPDHTPLSSPPPSATIGTSVVESPGPASETAKPGDVSTSTHTVSELVTQQHAETTEVKSEPDPEEIQLGIIEPGTDNDRAEGHAEVANNGGAAVTSSNSAVPRATARTLNDDTTIENFIETCHRVIEGIPDDHPDLPMWLNNLGRLFELRFQRKGDPEDIEEAISAQQQAVHLTVDGHPDLPLRLNNLGRYFNSRFDRKGNLADLEEAVSATHQAVHLTPDGHPDSSRHLNNLGRCFQSRFDHKGNLADLEAAISATQQAVNLTPDGYPGMARHWSNLSLSFNSRFECKGDLADLEKAISAIQQAIHFTPEDGPDLPIWLDNLGCYLQSRFNCKGDLSDLEAAISATQQAVNLIPDGHSDLPIWLNNLGNSFQYRFHRKGNLADLEAAISAIQQAVHLTPEGHPDLALRLSSLGSSFQSRFERTGDLADLEQAISAIQRAVHLTPEGHPDLAVRLNTLGSSIQSRFERKGDLADLEQAISIIQQAIHLTPEDHPDLPICLNNLGSYLQSRFQRKGNLADLEEAISAMQQAVHLTPTDHPDLPIWLDNLGGSFRSLFDRKGNLADLEQAISIIQQAVHLTPEGHPDLSQYLNNLGGSFQSRFDCKGDLADLEEAISVTQHAVHLISDGHPDLAWLMNNLGGSFHSRFEHMGDLADLEEAISTIQQAVHLTPDGHPDLPIRLDNLGGVFRSLFDRKGNLADLEQAISIIQQAIQLTPERHPDLSQYLNNLGGSFQLRFDFKEDLADLEEAISARQKAVHLTPEGHPDLSLYLNNLGGSFQSRFEHTKDLSDSFTALHLFQQSAKSPGSLLDRFEAAQNWAELSTNLHQSDILQAYTLAIELLSQIAGMDNTITQRYTHLANISGVTTSAASAAIASGKSRKALEWLEQGRCLVWIQMNQLRTPVDDLRAQNVQLADHFLAISSILESSGSRGGSNHRPVHTNVSMEFKMSLQDEAQLHLKSAREWDQLLGKIRHSVPGFHNFLQPTTASELLEHLPTNGPIILINVHESGCDALALVSGFDEPIHVPLTQFTYERAATLKDNLQNLLTRNGVRVREENRGIRRVPSDSFEDGIHYILQVLWLEVVKPILEGLAYSESALPDPGRIWWCPTGPLVFLPLHAAGIYCNPHDVGFPSSSCISDYAISSYTPTVSALLRICTRSQNRQASSSLQLLVISQPNTPGCRPIRYTTEEMAVIRKILSERKDCAVLGLEGEIATVSRVKSEMVASNWVHFACHADQNSEQPLKSGFALEDGRLELVEIIKQKNAQCELAFLSACQTGTGDEKLSEEAVHLAAGMLAVGYKSVVATMWSIQDKYAPVVAEGFYGSLAKNGTAVQGSGFNSTNAALALHHAIQGIRKLADVGDTEKGLLTWVPYVHFGY